MIRGGEYLPPLCERIIMRYKILASVLACMLLWGCDSSGDTSASQPTTASTVSNDAKTTAITKTNAITTAEKKAAEKTVSTATTIAATEAAKVSETPVQEQTYSISGEAVIDETVVDFSELIDVDAQVETTAATKAKTEIDNGGDMTDNDTVWTPLVPVD